MTIGIILLLVCLGSLLIVWVGLGGVQLSGALSAGLICVLIGALAIKGASGDTAYFWLSLGFIIAGVVISVIAVRKQKALKNFSAAVCVAIAVITGFYAIQYLTS
jgi:hypothetical protein